MEDLVIPSEYLNNVNMSNRDLLIDFAVYLYDKGPLSIGRAKRLAGLTHIEFQKEMAKRDVYLNYDMDALKEDMKTIERLGL